MKKSYCNLQKVVFAESGEPIRHRRTGLCFSDSEFSSLGVKNDLHCLDFSITKDIIFKSSH